MPVGLQEFEIPAESVSKAEGVMVHWGLVRMGVVAVAILGQACGGGSGGGGSGGSGGGVGGGAKLKGAIQKGPFVVGSMVQVAMVDSAGDPTGLVFNSTTNNDLGEFTLTVNATGAAEIITSGFYFNEVTGKLSGSSITLRALANVASSGTQQAYVNVVTHMAQQRAKKLLADGAAFDMAIAQAESQLRAALGVIQPDAVGAGTSMNILGGDSDDNAYLFAVSCILGQAARAAAASENEVDAKLQELVNMIALDLQSDGALNPATRTRLDDAQRALDAGQCSANMQKRLTEVGSDATLPNIEKALDFDGDGMSDFLDNDDDGDNLVGAADGITVMSSGTRGEEGILAVDKSGGVWGWTTSDTGAVGQPPRLVPGATGVVDVAVSRGERYAVKADGSLLMWGGDQMPAPVAGVSGVATTGGTLAGCMRGLLFVKADKTVWVLEGPNPMATPAIGVVGIASSPEDDTTVYQMDDGTVRSSYRAEVAPVIVNGPTCVTGPGRIAIVRRTAVAVDGGGNAWTWDAGGIQPGMQGNATQVAGISGIARLGVNNAAAMALAVKTDGTVWAWMPQGGGPATQVGLAPISWTPGLSRPRTMASFGLDLVRGPVIVV